MKHKTIVIAIQASAVSWEGGRDICLNAWEGRTVLEHTIQRAKDTFDGKYDVILLVPDLPENRMLTKIAAQHQVEILFGHIDDVVDRFEHLPATYTHALRIAGMHPFFSRNLARNMVRRMASEGAVDLTLPPKGLDVQLGCHLIRLEALRRMSGMENHRELRRDPLAWLCAHGASVLEMPPGRYEAPGSRRKLRQQAEYVYQDDILHAAPSHPSVTEHSGLSQIFAHYRQALHYINENDECSDRRILDIGGGLGFESFVDNPRGGLGRYFLVDIDHNKAARAVELNATGLSLCGDGRFLPIKARSMDVILCFETLEHLHRPQDVMTEARRVLKPGGWLCLSTPQNRSGRLPINPRHRFEFTRNAFDRFCRRYFDNPRYFTYHSGGHFDPGLGIGNNMMAILRKEAATLGES